MRKKGGDCQVMGLRVWLCMGGSEKGPQGGGEILPRFWKGRGKGLLRGTA